MISGARALPGGICDRHQVGGGGRGGGWVLSTVIISLPSCTRQTRQPVLHWVLRHCYCPLRIHTPYMTPNETRVISNTKGPLRLDHPPPSPLPPAPDRGDTFDRVSRKVATGDRSRAATLHGHSDLCVGHTSYHLPTCPTTFEISFYEARRSTTFVSCRVWPC